MVLLEKQIRKLEEIHGECGGTGKRIKRLWRASRHTKELIDIKEEMDAKKLETAAMKSLETNSIVKKVLEHTDATLATTKKTDATADQIKATTDATLITTKKIDATADQINTTTVDIKAITDATLTTTKKTDATADAILIAAKNIDTKIETFKVAPPKISSVTDLQKKLYEIYKTYKLDLFMVEGEKGNMDLANNFINLQVVKKKDQVYSLMETTLEVRGLTSTTCSNAPIVILFLWKVLQAPENLPCVNIYASNGQDESRGRFKALI